MYNTYMSVHGILQHTYFQRPSIFIFKRTSLLHTTPSILPIFHGIILQQQIRYKSTKIKRQIFNERLFKLLRDLSPYFYLYSQLPTDAPKRMNTSNGFKALIAENRRSRGWKRQQPLILHACYKQSTDIQTRLIKLIPCIV